MTDIRVQAHSKKDKIDKKSCHLWGVFIGLMLIGMMNMAGVVYASSEELSQMDPLADVVGDLGSGGSDEVDGSMWVGHAGVIPTSLSMASVSSVSALGLSRWGWLNRLKLAWPVQMRSVLVGAAGLATGWMIREHLKKSLLETSSLSQIRQTTRGELVPAVPTRLDQNSQLSDARESSPTPQPPKMAPVVMSQNHDEQQTDHSKDYVLGLELQRFSDYAQFLSISQSDELLAMLAFMSTHDVKQAMLELDPSSQSHPWNRRQLFEFISSSVESARELHILLSSLQKKKWFFDSQFLSVYGESDHGILEMRRLLASKISSFNRALPHVRLAQGATDRQMKQALLAMESHEIRHYLEPLLAKYNILMYTDEQWPLVQAKYIVEYMYMSDMMGGNVRRRIYEYLGVVTTQVDPYGDAFIWRVPHMFNNIRYHLADREVLISGDMSRFMNVKVPESSRDHAHDLYDQYRALSFSQVRSVALRLWGNEGLYLQKSWIDDFMTTLDRSPVLKALFLSQIVLHNQKLKDFADSYELLLADVLYFSSHLKTVFHRYYTGRVSALKHRHQHVDPQVLRTIDDWIQFTPSVKTVYEHRSFEEIVGRIKTSSWFDELFDYEVLISEDHYKLFESAVLYSPQRQDLFASDMMTSMSGISKKQLSLTHQQAIREKQRIIIEWLHVLLYNHTDMTSYHPRYFTPNPSQNLLDYYQSALVERIVHRDRRDAQWLDLISKKAQSLEIVLPITPSMVREVQNLEEDLVSTEAHLDAMLLVFYGLGYHKVTLSEIARTRRMHAPDLKQWMSQFKSRWVATLTDDVSSLVSHTPQNSLKASAVDDVLPSDESGGLTKAELQKYFDDLSFSQLEHHLWLWVQNQSRVASTKTWNPKVISVIYDFTDMYLSSALDWDVFISVILGFEESLESTADFAESRLLSPSDFENISKNLSEKLDLFMAHQLLLLEMK